jgi:hypothetical protein
MQLRIHKDAHRRLLAEGTEGCMRLVVGGGGAYEVNDSTFFRMEKRSTNFDA